MLLCKYTPLSPANNFGYVDEETVAALPVKLATIIAATNIATPLTESIINTKMSISDFNNEFNNLISEGLYETVGGYIINKIGRIPHKNEHLFLNIGHVIIRRGSSRKIEQIQLFLN